MTAKKIDKHGRCLHRVSVKVEKGLEEGIRTLGVPGCRPMRGVCLLLLEAGMAISENTSAPVTVLEYPGQVDHSGLAGHLSFYLPENLWNSVRAKAEALGFNIPEMIRIFLWTGLVHHKKNLSKGRVVLKEALVRSIAQSQSRQARWDEFCQGLRLIRHALLGR